MMIYNVYRKIFPQMFGLALSSYLFILPACAILKYEKKKVILYLINMIVALKHTAVIYIAPPWLQMPISYPRRWPVVTHWRNKVTAPIIALFWHKNKDR